MQPYFKVYQSFFQNETYVAELTDLEKVLLMLVSSEMNRKEAKSSATGETKIMRFSHYWMASALSSHRTKISKAFKGLKKFRLFDYTSGFNVNGGRTAPSTISNLAKEEFYVQIDRYTFEHLLYGKLKNKEIKYRHIIVYALCKYIEQFKGGSITVNEFGHMLGMASEEIKYTRIKKPLEDLQSMKLISFQKKHGKIEGITVSALQLSTSKQNKLRVDVRLEAEKLRYEELGIINNEVAAAVDDMKVPESLDDILNNVKDIFVKRTGKKAVLNADQKKRIFSSTVSIRQLHEYIQQFFHEKNTLELQRMDNVFSNINVYVQGKEVQKYFN